VQRRVGIEHWLLMPMRLGSGIGFLVMGIAC